MGLTKVRGKGLGTLGDGTASDNSIVFDGNAQDFHIGLDDSSDNLTLGVGSSLGTNTAINIDSSGRVFTPVRPAFFAYSTSDTTIASQDTDQKILFQAEDFDKTNNFANSEFTAPVSGLYQFNTSISFYANNVSARYVRTRIFKNGSSTTIECHTHMSDETSASDYTNCSMSVTLDLSANDVISVYGATQQGSNQIYIAGFNKTTHFSGYLIG